MFTFYIYFNLRTISAVTELNLNFTNLQVDLDAMNVKQKELKENQEVLSSNLQVNFYHKLHIIICICLMYLFRKIFF